MKLGSSKGSILITLVIVVLAILFVAAFGSVMSSFSSATTTSQPPATVTTTIPVVTTATTQVTHSVSTSTTFLAGEWKWAYDFQYATVRSSLPFKTVKLWDDSLDHAQVSVEFQGYYFKFEIGTEVVTDRPIEANDDNFSRDFRGRPEQAQAFIRMLNDSLTITTK